MKKIIWVTGGTKGLGKEIVLSFAKEGHTVITNYLEDDKAATILEDEVKKNKYDIKIFKADVCNWSELQPIKNYIEKYEKLDFLINNAGIGKIGTVNQMSGLDFAEIMNVNLVGKYNCIRLCIPLLSKSMSPSIINVSSASGVRASAGMGAYCVSQAGIQMMTQVLAKELISSGIRVNSVSPSMLEAGMSQNCFSQEDRDVICRYHPMKRLGNFRDVFVCIRWLCSEEASYINGENIMITGGN